MAKNDFDEDTPLYSASTGTKSKLKGGPSKKADLKPAKMTKVAAPKTDKLGGGGGKFKAAPKAGKISVPKAKSHVRASPHVQKASAQFSLPRPAMPSKSAATAKTGGKKRR